LGSDKSVAVASGTLMRLGLASVSGDGALALRSDVARARRAKLSAKRRKAIASKLDEGALPAHARAYRAMALGEVRLRDWWRVVRREISAGLVLGSILGSIGLVRILTWVGLFGSYGQHFLLVGSTVAMSLVGVVTFGTFAGSLLPFVLRRFGFDPASACAPFVATLVDVSGLVIYFSVASLILSGTLL